MNALYLKLRKEQEARSDQSGINMVDLMMWLVIAALLLAAALQGIAYYQQATWLYQMKSDLSGVGANVQAAATLEKNGKITKPVADTATAQSKWSKDITYSVDEATVSGRLPYLRAMHPGVLDKDAIYLFESCGEEYNIGVNVIPKGSSAVLEDCGITSPGTTTTDDIDGDGIPNSSDEDIDGDGTPNTTDTDIDGDGTPNAEDTTPNGEPDPATGGDTTTTDPTTGGDTTTTNPDAGSGTDTTTVSTKCTGLSADAEASCWMDEVFIAQDNYFAANSAYFGNETGYAAPELEGAPLTMSHSAYGESGDGWYYYGFDSTVVARDGWFWTKGKGVDHGDWGTDPIDHPLEKTVNHRHYTCDSLGSGQLLSQCEVVGKAWDHYSVPSTQNSTATADIQKVMEANVAHMRATGGLYGGNHVPVDVKSWAGTTLQAHVWNDPDDAYSNRYSMITVTDTNGDIYTVSQRIWETDPTVIPMPMIFSYTPEEISTTCSRPYVSDYQWKNIPVCQTFGYTEYKEPIS